MAEVAWTEEAQRWVRTSTNPSPRIPRARLSRPRDFGAGAGARNLSGNRPSLPRSKRNVRILLYGHSGCHAPSYAEPPRFRLGGASTARRLVATVILTSASSRRRWSRRRSGRRRSIESAFSGGLRDEPGGLAPLGGILPRVAGTRVRQGQNIVIEGRWYGDRSNGFRLAAELIGSCGRDRVRGLPPAPEAAKRATSTIPIVMASHGDPVGSGLVASLAKPGGNVTGLSIVVPELSGKQLQLLKEVVPRLTRVAVLWNPTIPDQAHRLERGGGRGARAEGAASGRGSTGSERGRRGVLGGDQGAG